MVLKEGANVKCDLFHDFLSHVGEQAICDTAPQLGVRLTGTPRKCEHWAMAKAKQKNVNKEVDCDKLSVIPGERLSFDVSSVKKISLGGSKFWLLIVDEATDVCWSFFLMRKSDLSENMLALTQTSSTQGHVVNFLRCDNAGENTTLEALTIRKGMNITHEFTAPGTPQQNARCERKFVTSHGRMRAMMNSAHFSQKIKDELWTECAATATKLDNITVIEKKSVKQGEGKGRSPHSKFFYNKNPQCLRCSRKFGEIGIVTDHATRNKAKLQNHGFPAIVMGHPEDHT